MLTMRHNFQRILLSPPVQFKNWSITGVIVSTYVFLPYLQTSSSPLPQILSEYFY